MAKTVKNGAPKIERVRKTYTITKRTAGLIESHKYATDGCEVDFITAAVENYCADIDGTKNLDILCDRIYKIVSAELDSHFNRLANILFKFAVEEGIQNHMLAAGYVNLTDSEMRYIRNQVTNTVRRSHGFLSFEKALEKERNPGDGD